MVSTQTSESAVVEGSDRPHVPAFVDWIVGALLVLGGLALALGGSALWLFVDREVIATAVAEDSIQSGTLADADLVEVALSTTTWTAIGLLLTGMVLLIGGVTYVVLRRRTHARASAGEPTSNFVANSLVGAFVTVLLSFVPFSPAIGGAVAGYFERGESERVLGVGALSGLLTATPIVTIVLFVLGGVSAGLLAIGDTAIATFVAIVFLVGVVVVATFSAGLGALGGYVGGRLAEDRLD